MGIAVELFLFARTEAMYQSTCQLIVHEKRTALPVEPDVSNRYKEASAHLDHSYIIRTAAVVRNAWEHGGLDDVFESGTNPEAQIRSGLAAYWFGKDKTIINLSFSSENPSLCQPVVNEIVAAYERFLSESDSEVGAETVSFIAEAEQNLRQNLKVQNARYKEFRIQHPLSTFKRGGKGVNIYQSRQGLIETRRFEILLNNGQFSAKLRAAKAAIDAGVNPLAFAELHMNRRVMRDPANVSDSAMIPVYGTNANALEQRIVLEALLQVYGEDHPKVISLRKRIAMVLNPSKWGLQTDQDQPLEGNGKGTNQIQELAEHYLEGLRYQLAMGMEEYGQMEEMYQNEQRDADQLELFLVEDQMYRDEIDRTKNLFDTVVERLQQVNLVEVVSGSRFNVQLLSNPSAARKTGPLWLRFVVMGATFGSLFGFTLAFWVDRSDRTFRSPEDLSRSLRLQLLGHVPTIREKTSKKQGKGGLSIDPRLITAHSPKSQTAEAFRAVRTALYFNSRSKDHQLIQVTSPTPGDGKSTLSGNLAISIAQSGKKTLLLDADFRRPVIHKRFGLTSDLGLASLVNETAELSDVIVPTQIKNLDAIACGPRPDNPAELLTSNSFKSLLNTLRSEYDLVIIDTPPLLAVTDPSIVAAQVDGVVLAMRLRKNARQFATQSIEVLREVEAKIIGVVVNHVGEGGENYGVQGRYGYGRRRTSYGGYGYGYGGYGYGYGGYRYGYGGYGTTTDDTIENYYDEQPTDVAPPNNGRHDSKQ